MLRKTVKQVTFIAIKRPYDRQAFSLEEKHSASKGMLKLKSILYVSYQCEFVPLVNIDPGKLLLRTRAKIMVPLEFGAMDGQA